MRSFSFVPDEPRDQLAIEVVGSDKQLLMVINEFFLNRAIKSLHMAVDFWVFWDRYASGSYAGF
jgi:hypothetical protein